MVDIIPANKELKREARTALFSDYGTVLISSLLFTAMSFGFIMLSDSYCVLLSNYLGDNAIFLVSLTFDIISLLLLYPFFMGYAFVLCKITDSDSCSVSELLHFYSSKNELLRCFVFLIRKIPEILLKLVLPFVLLDLCRKYLPEALGFISEIGFAGFAVVFSKCFFLVEIAFILIVMYFCGGLLLSVSAFCRREKVSFAFSEKLRFFRLRLSLIPLLLLSVLSFGILYITYTLPFSFIVYSMFAKGKISSEVRGSDTVEFTVPFSSG